MTQNDYRKTDAWKCPYQRSTDNTENVVYPYDRKFWTISDDRLGQFTAAKLCIELRDSHTKHLHSTPYKADSKTREFENAEIDNMLEQQKIELI